jgi:outer membrane protein assembly factor BamB
MREALRLWPGVAAAAVLLLMRYVLPLLWPQAGLAGLLSSIISTVVIVVWWLAFSRAPWPERLAPFAVMAMALVVTRPLLHESIAGGAMGGLGYILAMPAMCLALVVWVVATRRWPGRSRWVSLPVAMLIAGAAIATLRTDGVGGSNVFQLQWRWTPTAEARLLAEVQDEPSPVIAPAPADRPGTASANHDVAVVPSDAATAGSAAASNESPAIEWPGFRGRNRDGVVRGVRIDTNWSRSPPVELWRRRIGPGWSSFAVAGDLLYTQEQRGDDEIVSCYRVSTGEPVWRHRDSVRFYESNGGAGPRGTPALANGQVYTFGATGLLNALDARTGALVWARDAARDAKVDIPMWGFSSSPLVADNVVIVAVEGTLAGYDRATGERRWLVAKTAFSYSSPHLVTIDGVAQVLLLRSPGVVSVRPSDGTVLWEHAWESGAVVQPAIMPDGDILITAMAMTGGTGVRRLAVTHAAGRWSVQERWTSNGLKPYFNDYVVHKGHAYGFDGSILASVDLADGKRTWKGGRYGDGQLLLLADQDLLLVLSDDGQLALVSATPDAFTEIAHAPAIDGKTWNHPVLIGNVLLVRNGEEMAAFRLPAASDAAARR